MTCEAGDTDFNLLLAAGTRPKKNIVCSRFPTNPIKTYGTQIYFMDFQIILGNP